MRTTVLAILVLALGVVLGCATTGSQPQASLQQASSTPNLPVVVEEPFQQIEQQIERDSLPDGTTMIYDRSNFPDLTTNNAQRKARTYVIIFPDNLTNPVVQRASFESNGHVVNLPPRYDEYGKKYYSVTTETQRDVFAVVTGPESNRKVLCNPQAIGAFYKLKEMKVELVGYKKACHMRVHLSD